MNATDQFKDFELNTVSRFDYNYDDDDSKVTINLINQENSDSFYQQIDQSDELLAITCIDNGSTQQLKSLLSNEGKAEINATFKLLEQSVANYLDI